MIADSIKSLHNGDVGGAIPWPKLVDNLIKA